MANPYASLNLRRNPFGELTRKEWVDLAVTDLDQAKQWLQRPGVAIQLLAEKGRGKTTHLLKLDAELSEAIYFRASRDCPPTQGPILLMDEAQSLWPWERAQIARRFSSLAYSTHRDLSLQFQLQGFRVRTLHVERTSLEQLQQIVTRRIAGAAMQTGPLPTIEPKRLEMLHKRFNDDIRGIFDELYDAIQHRVSTHV